VRIDGSLPDSAAGRPQHALAASIAVTGQFEGGPAIGEARLLISRTAPNAAKYNARPIDYNNDPTITFEDLQSLLKRVEINLRKGMARQEK
jgi:hypothetical protein